MLKLAVILSLCPFKAHGGGLRNLKTLTYLQRMVSLCRYFFLYFAVDPFYSEINATLAVIGRCPFHIRFRKRMAPCEANAPNAVKCTDSLTNSFTSLSCFSGGVRTTIAKHHGRYSKSDHLCQDGVE